MAPDPPGRLAPRVRDAAAAAPRDVRVPVRRRSSEAAMRATFPRSGRCGRSCRRSSGTSRRTRSGACCVSRGIEPRRRRRRHAGGSASGSDVGPARLAPRRWPVRDSPAWRSTDVDGVLLDIDGVLAVSWEPLPGAVEAMRWLRRAGICRSGSSRTRRPTRGATSPRRSRRRVRRRARRDRDGGRRDRLLPAERITRARACSCSPTATRARTSRASTSSTSEDADVVVLGGACDDFTYAP